MCSMLLFSENCKRCPKIFFMLTAAAVVVAVPLTGFPDLMYALAHCSTSLSVKKHNRLRKLTFSKGLKNVHCFLFLSSFIFVFPSSQTSVSPESWENCISPHKISLREEWIYRIPVVCQHLSASESISVEQYWSAIRVSFHFKLVINKIQTWLYWRNFFFYQILEWWWENL